MKTINEVDISDKRLLIRVDFNVPMDNNLNIRDDSRIKRVLDTINYALENNAKIILASHLGRPKGRKIPELSLAPVAEHLSDLIKKEVKLAPDCVGPDVKKMLSEMQQGDVVLLENLRFHAEEKKNDENFAASLASFCDIYINDAFAVSHRAHASVEAAARYAPTAVAGFLLKNELDYFKKAMDNPKRPLVAILGGAKISTKLEALNKILEKVDKAIIGGAMANTFLKSMGYNVGQSMVEDDHLLSAKAVLKKAASDKIPLYIPIDAIVADDFDQNAEKKLVPIQEVPSNQMIMDIGPATSMLYSEVLRDAQTIVWNGPVGVFEIDAFSRGTMDIAEYIVNSQALTIVGGGDTNAALHKAGLEEYVTYISTGGGAFLCLLEGSILPAISALNQA
ncbi:Phosphoglycerate kinase [Candidatus Magnetomoraceae bacterium gMMP-15]